QLFRRLVEFHEPVSPDLLPEGIESLATRLVLLRFGLRYLTRVFVKECQYRLVKFNRIIELHLRIANAVRSCASIPAGDDDDVKIVNLYLMLNEMPLFLIR